MRRQNLPTLHVSEAELWKQALVEGTITGSVASVLSTAVLAAAGALQTGSATAALNAVSHWLWGDESLFAEHPTLRHTLTGYLTQHAASIFWGVLYSRVYGHRDSAKEWPQAVAGGIATSVVAAVVDYGLVPKRLTPGYEHRVSPGAMIAIYGALAAGFAVGAVALGKGGLGGGSALVASPVSDGKPSRGLRGSQQPRGRKGPAVGGPHAIRAHPAP